MKRRRGEDQSDVISGKEIVFSQTVSEGVELSSKFGVRKAVAFSSIDDEVVLPPPVVAVEQRRRERVYCGRERG
ncbi:hypothetical protein Goari_026722 [Gossypium aridum]|uniref:Uncharacterized protein n=1 Tax=Gossypium aridum TaxID=34290 RepID=A0A7J8XE52_GOSAI|nr:hypothetical protein [Gossypium aridum]